MKKKFLFLVLLLTFVLPTFADASNGEDKKNAKLTDFEITNPKEEAAIVPGENIVLTGIGVEKDKIDIEVYSVKRTLPKDKDKEKEAVIKKLNNSYVVNVDALKVFAQEIELKEGENLVVITVTRGDRKYTVNKTVNYNKNMELNKIIRQLEYKDSVN
ncbi:MAG: hypothetical protein ACTTHM_05960 [Peptoanaerobacter stomatis]|uniref:Uncharacterized protein n=1 Tax=Peptoanaerobacter stomatis TaxID=796937 RepID=G9XCT3_9FIRM|nr:hypothetical protein [Peptoanaerobacter stomatis]EHL19269.1 hypothetical protein HMPREF9628_01660 [Peptoanaerobacter stomatis]